jgi:preprotein translocase subunit SecE
MRFLKIFNKIPKFLKEVRLELKKVTWPTRKELTSATGVVLAGAVFLTLYIGLVDLGLSKIMQSFLK